MDIYLTLLEKTKGQDKMCKLNQYITKLIIYKTGNQRLSSMENYLSITRRILKSFNFLSIFVNYRGSTVIEDISIYSDCISSVLDYLILLIKFGLISKDFEDCYDNWSKRLWLINAICNRYIDYLKFKNKKLPLNYYLKFGENIMDTIVQFSGKKSYVIYSGIVASVLSLILLINQHKNVQCL